MWKGWMEKGRTEANSGFLAYARMWVVPLAEVKKQEGTDSQQRGVRWEADGR